MSEGPLNSDWNAHWGQQVRLLRELKGFSQRELAKRSGVTHSNISMIEQGQVSPSLQSLSRILHPLEISLPDFFGCAINNAPRLISSDLLSPDLLTMLPDSLGASIRLIKLDTSTGPVLFMSGTRQWYGCVLSGDLMVRTDGFSDVFAARALFDCGSHSCIAMSAAATIPALVLMFESVRM